ncbi:hypothetical protein ASPVEDRAFT_206852 [Aspergillus versicolor CBS 583.65]|uniref:Protein kinase domain-containing protein n=1 Tax=Aspergillus versicolor CBS 583.65 TaxID=1036611 RepID=A0A1L9P2W9_ASPVE|nr:uncharacterized protein ASPVEDRAFT_206852 [Aspergillus versicolor CBS 583.65]OJI95865.1 hypothetical protein ASPVEDRAFT_206852 [Aspergillus versicolor CBS 583.65]
MENMNQITYPVLREDAPIRDLKLSSAQFTGLPDEVDFDDDNPFSGSCTTARYTSPDETSYTILIECQLSALEGSKPSDAELRRRNQVVALLSKASQLLRDGDTTCRIPKCLGWFTFRALHDGTETEILAFASEVPPWVDPTIPPFSLRKIMEQEYWIGKSRPSLNARIRLARAVAQVVYNLQCAQWLHRSFGGHQIMFFYDESGNLHMDEPFLRGLLHSLLDEQPVENDHPVRDGVNAQGSGSYSEPVVETHVYRHPDLWTANPREYRPSDDIYSLGVVLLEIGMWRIVGPDVKQREDVHLLKVAKQTLPAATGETYLQVVVDCLEGMQSDSRADAGSSNEGGNGLERQLLWKVLRPLEQLGV